MVRIFMGWLFCIICLYAFLPAQTRFEEHNGLVVMEVESAPLASGWRKDTDVTGYAGSGYYTWTIGGPTDLTAAGQGILTYRFKINNAGTYNMRLHNYHDYPADNTLENDCWVKMDGGSWVKCFQTAGSAGSWNFISQLEVSHGNIEYASYDLSAGDHTFYISGRSSNYSVDRIHLYRQDMVSRPFSTGHPQSPLEGQALTGDQEVHMYAPAAGTVLQQGQTYTFIGSGPMLFWKYDLGADGEGITSLSIKDTAALKIPERDRLEKIAIHLYSSFKTEVVIFDVISASAIHDARTAEHCRYTLRTMDGNVRLGPGSGASRMNIYTPAGSRIASVVVRAGQAAWSGAGFPAGLYMVGLQKNTDEHIIPVVLTR